MIETDVSLVEQGELDDLDALVAGCRGRFVLSNTDILDMKMSDDDMKFSNGDVSLDEIVERNGGHLTMSNAEILCGATR